MKDFMPGEKYKDIKGLKDVFESFGKGKPLSDIQTSFIIDRCFYLGWNENKPVQIDSLMDLLLAKI